MASPQHFILSPLDQQAPKVNTRMALVFPVTDYEPAIAVLQAALAKTCEQVPYLKGKVIEKEESGRKVSFIELDPSDPPVQFVEQPCPSGIPTYAELKTNRTPFNPEIFPQPVLPGTVAPVMGASFTKIEGGLVVAITTNHKVFDGTGYYEICRLLAKNAQSLDAESPVSADLPDPDELLKRRRLILGGVDAPLPSDRQGETFETLLARHPEYTSKSLRIKEQAKGGIGTASAGNGAHKIMALSGNKIDAVKAALADKLPSDVLTVNKILMAIFWTAITHIRSTRPGEPLEAEKSTMDYPVGGRRFVGKSLTDRPYLGNALCFAQTALPIADINFMPSPDAVENLIPIIQTIAKASDHLNAAHIASMVQLSDATPDFSDVSPAWLFNGPGDLHFISWSHIRVYDLDFGSKIGKPAYMKKALMKFNGIVNFLPRRGVKNEEGEEEIDVSVLLRQEDMERLCEDGTWRSWLVENGV